MNLGTKEEYVARFKNSMGNRAEEAAKDWEHLSKVTKGKDISKIPKGDYCYVFVDGINKYGIPNTKSCPYYSFREYNGVRVPYCEYMEYGDIGNHTTEEEYKKLLEYFGSKEKLDKELPLMLLFDSCKECGENHYTKEEEKEMYDLFRENKGDRNEE